LDVTPDGSPVAVYRALPLEPEFTPALAAIPAGASVLDLGCGAGRLANALAARGHPATAVDESADMLAHLDPRVVGVRSRIEDVRLGHRFDVVVLASNLVNVADAGTRQGLLRTARSHVAPAGVVVVEHFDTSWTAGVPEVEGRTGPVHVLFRPLARRGDLFDAAATYTLERRSWTQLFTARVLDDAGLDAALQDAGLRRAERLSPRWLLALPSGDRHEPSAGRGGAPDGPRR
jgi:SAM-dependent methyltransferase